MKTNLIEQILQEKRKLRQLNIEKADNLKQIALQHEEFKKLDEQESTLIIETGKLAFLKQNFNEQIERLKEIDEKKTNILKELNINSTDLKVKTQCNKCFDTGYVNDTLCDCVKSEYSKKILSLSNINLNDYNYLKSYNFAVFDKNTCEKMQKIVNILKKYVNSYELKTFQNINFCGYTGTGKTYLSLCLAKEIQRLNKVITYTTAFNLNSEFLKAHTYPINEKQKILEHFLNTDFLIIDDLGSEPFYKNVTSEYLFLIINERQCNNLPTLITTNLMPNGILDKYGERVFSRVFNKQKALTFNFDSADLRLK